MTTSSQNIQAALADFTAKITAATDAYKHEIDLIQKQAIQKFETESTQSEIAEEAALEEQIEHC